VWQQYFPTLALGTVTASAFSTLTSALPDSATSRDAAVQVLDEARQARDYAVEALRLTAVKVPAIIEGVVDESSGLLDDLARVYAIKMNSIDKIIARAKTLSPLWASANAWQTSRVPARAAITRGTMTQPIFAVQVGYVFPMLQTVKDKEQDLDEMRGALRTAAHALERLCIRFLKAAGGLADPGSAAEAALATIPTTTVSDLPETLGVKTFTQGKTNGLQLLVAYEPYALTAGETAVLQYQRVDLDPGWQQVAYDASGNALGPFLVGQTVKVRTKVTNASGSREGGTRQLTLITPPS